MKKPICDRCKTSLIDASGHPVPHYSMKDPKCKRLRLNKNERFVCVPCVDLKERAREQAVSLGE